MAIRNIVKEGDGILGKKCRPVEKFDPKLWMLLDDMKETLREANGVGLSLIHILWARGKRRRGPRHSRGD